MIAQTMIVALLVIACAAHATWRLMPAALRHTLAARLLRRELRAAGGCGGCDGCGGAAKAAAAPGAPQPLRFHPRGPR